MCLCGKKKAIIFDMDGVLVNSEKYYIQLIGKMLAMNGKQVKERELYPLVGADEEQCLEYLCTLWNEPCTREKIKKDVDAFIRNNRPEYKKLLFDEVPYVLKTLFSKGYIMAIASSSPMNSIKKMLAETKLEKYFNAVVSGEKFRKSKPEPEIYEHVVKELGLSKEECVIVEDSTYGIEAGKRACVDVIAIKREDFCQQYEKADIIIDTLQKLLDILA